MKSPRPFVAVSEALESRVLFAVNAWKTAVSGDWDDATKWSLGHVPTAAEDAQITIAGNFTVTKSTTAADSVKSLVSTHALVLAGGSLNVGSTVQVSNIFTLNGGKLIHATVNAGTGGQGITAGPSTSSALDGVTLNADMTMQNISVVTVMHGLTLQNNHTITIQSTGAFTRLIFDNVAGAQTLGGTGKVIFAGTAPQNDQFNVQGQQGGALTIDTGITVRGPMAHFGSGGGVAPFLINKGTITTDVAGGKFIFDAQSPISNQGVMSAAANGAELQINCPIINTAGKTISATNGGILSLNGLNWSNAGTIAINASTLNLGGTFNNPGTITRTGATTVNLTGVNDKAGGVFALNATTGSWNFKGGTIKNAKLQFSGGANLVLTQVNFLGNILDKCTLDTDLAVPNGLGLNIRNGLTINAGRTLSVNSTGLDTAVTFLNQSLSQTVGGSGTILFGGTSANSRLVSTTGNVTFGSGITIRGKSGTLSTGLDANTKITNQGLILADTAGATILIGGSGVFTNTGNLMAAPGTININQAFNATGGNLTIGIGGNVAGTSFGRINIATATLGGTLNVVTINNFTPSVGPNFAALTFGTKTGSFATMNLNAGNGIVFNATVNPLNITLTRAAGGASIASRAAAVLTVTGTANPDTMSLAAIPGVLVAKVGASTSVFAASAITSAFLNGNNGDDTITVTANVVSTLSGGIGNDKLNGGPAADRLSGEAGNDSLTGNGGNDLLFGGDGNDTYVGGAGNDTYVFNDVGAASPAETDFVSETANAGTDTLDFSAVTSAITGNLGSDTLATHTKRTVKTLTAGQFANFENFFGGTNNDKITGNAAVNLLKGNNGNDTFFMLGGGKDTGDGGAGTDIDGSHDAGIDVLISIP